MEDAEIMGSDVQRAIELFGLPPHKTSFMTYWFDEWMDDEQLRRMLSDPMGHILIPAAGGATVMNFLIRSSTSE